MIHISPEDVRLIAEEEFRQEQAREAIEKYKQKLREKRSFIDRVFPWRVVIVKKGKSK